MNKIIFKAAACLLASAAVVSCEDVDDEITSVDYARTFSPSQVSARVINRTTLRLTWEQKGDATSYTVQLATDSVGFESTMVKEITGIETSPLVQDGFDGDTKYYGRIKAQLKDKPESVWMWFNFKTDTEQIMLAEEDGDVEAKTVTLRWPAGSTVTHVTYAAAGADTATYQLTDAEKEAGVATIEGLTPETTYNFTLYNGEKVRGSKTATTLLDLGGATLVEAGSDIAAVIADAEEGAILALEGGTYTISAGEEATYTAGKLELAKSITIRAARPTDRPTINGRIALQNGASLKFQQVVLDGKGSSGDQAIVFETDAVTYDSLVIEDCTIKNYTKGFYYVNVACTIGSLSINNCIIDSVECSGGDLFDCRKGYIGNLSITNTTVMRSCAARDFIRYDDASSTFGGSPVITVSNCTLDGVSNDAGRRLLYVRYAGNTITFTNNCVSNMPDCGRGFSDQGNTATPTFSNNNYFNTKNLTAEGGDGKAKFFDDKGKTLDPQYKDAANGDFTIGNIDFPKNCGDPRWYYGQ